MSILSSRNRTVAALSAVAVLAAVIGGAVFFVSRGTTSEQAALRTPRVEALVAETDLPLLVAQADAIVIGRVDRSVCVSRKGDMGEKERQGLRERGMSEAQIEKQSVVFKDRVYTDWGFTVERSLKGDSPDDGTVLIHRPGGELNGDKFELPGYPELAKGGRRQVVFLVKTLDGSNGIIAVYAINGNTVSNARPGRKDVTTLEELIAQVEAHKGDPNPYQNPPASSGGNSGPPESTTPTESFETSPTL